MVDLNTLAIIVLQGGIFLLFVVAVRRQNTAAAVNAIGSFVLAVLPVIVEVGSEFLFARSITFGSTFPLWLAVAGLLHSLGMLGLYDSRWWWDHLTHTVSAALVAALIHAGLVVTLPGVSGIALSDGVLATVTVAFTFAIGVFWELIELVAREVGDRFGIEPVLVHYGWRDTAVDLGFDIVGALLVVLADLRVFVPIMERFPGVTGALLFGTGWTVFVGSIVMALLVGTGSSARA